MNNFLLTVPYAPFPLLNMKTTQIDIRRTERINTIIQQRQRFASRIERDKANLEACKLALVNLKQYQSEFPENSVDATST